MNTVKWGEFFTEEELPEPTNPKEALRYYINQAGWALISDKYDNGYYASALCDYGLDAAIAEIPRYPKHMKRAFQSLYTAAMAREGYMPVELKDAQQGKEYWVYKEVLVESFERRPGPGIRPFLVKAGGKSTIVDETFHLYYKP